MRLLLVLVTMFLGFATAQNVVLRALMEDVPETRIVQELLPQFTAETGITVEFEIVAFAAMHDKLVAQLLAPESGYDFIQVDFLWVGLFPAAGWLEPLEPFIEATGFDLTPYLPTMLDLVGYYQNTLYMVPMYNYAMGLIYRTDLLEQNDLQAAFLEQHGRELGLPKDLAEYVEISRFMAANAGVAGAAMQGMRGDPNFMEFSNYLFSVGGDYVDEDWNVTLNSPEGIKALSLYVQNIQEAAPLGAFGFNLDDTFRVMCHGRAWSMISYWWMLPQLNDPELCPEVAGKVTVAPMPGVAGVNGGWGWAIPANSVRKDAAWQFIAWVESPEIVRERALRGHAPTRTDAFRNPEVLARFPYYSAIEDMVAHAKKVPIFPFTAMMGDVIGREVSLAAIGEKSVEQALADAERGLQDLLRSAGLGR